jgi:hypothetical protein
MKNTFIVLDIHNCQGTAAYVENNQGHNLQPYYPIRYETIPLTVVEFEVYGDNK